MGDDDLTRSDRRSSGGVRRAGSLLAACLGVALLVAGCGGDLDPTGSGSFATDPDELTAMVSETSTESGADPLYCHSDSGPVPVSGWLRGPDDYQILAGETLGMSYDPGGVMVWDTEQGFGLELLSEELSLLGMDEKGLSSDKVFSDMISSGAGELRCRNLDEEAWPSPGVTKIYTMADVSDGEMTPAMVQSLLESFNDF